MEYLIQIEEYGRVTYNRRHRSSQPNVALRRALEQHGSIEYAEAYVANKQGTIWTYIINNHTARPIARRDSDADATTLMSGNIRLSMTN